MLRDNITKWTIKGKRNTAISVFQCTLLLTISLLFCASSLAKENAIDIALVLDASGSMKKNDPHRMRIDAAKMFVSLLDRKDRVSLVSFDSRAYPVTRLLSLDKKQNENALMHAIDNMVANGKFTNLHDALSQGYEILKNNKISGREKHIVLMSDGKMDLGNKERNLRLLEKTLEELTPKFAAENIKVHTIAFTKNSYIPLLKLTAEDTNGQFVLLKDTSSIHQVFETVFVRTKKPEEIPLKEDSFVVDKDVKELTIVASKYKSASLISLESPDAKDISKAVHSDKVKWFSAKQFELITIKNPDPGYWLIKFSEGGNKAYILSDLALSVESTKQVAEPGTPLHIRAFLNKKGKIVKNKSLLKASTFRIKVTSPAGSTLNNELIDDGSEIGSERYDGIYGISYAFDNEGTYKVEVEVNSETFDRKKVLYIDVKSFSPNQPFATNGDPSPRAAESQAVKQQAAQPLHEEPAIDQEKIAESAIEHNQSHHAEESPHETKENDPVQNEHNKIDEQATTHEVDHAEEHSDSDADSDPEAMHAKEGGYSLKEAFIFFVLFNCILAAAGGAYYYFYRKKQKEKSKESEQEEPVKNPEAFDENAVDLSESDNSNEFAEKNEEKSSPDLEKEENTDSNSASEAADDLSEIDLEAELSSILESEENNTTEKND